MAGYYSFTAIPASIDYSYNYTITLTNITHTEKGQYVEEEHLMDEKCHYNASLTLDENTDVMMVSCDAVHRFKVKQLCDLLSDKTYIMKQQTNGRCSYTVYNNESPYGLLSIAKLISWIANIND